MREQEAVLSGAKDFDELVDFMQKSGLSNQQIEGALEAHEVRLYIYIYRYGYIYIY